MSRYIDLDDLVPDDIVVRIDGEDYRLPGDIPVPTYLEFERLQVEVMSEDPEVARPAAITLHDRMLSLFREHQPDLEDLPVGARRLLPLLFRYLNPDAAPQVEEPDAGRPTRPAGTTRKTAGSRRKTTTKTPAGSR